MNQSIRRARILIPVAFFVFLAACGGRSETATAAAAGADADEASGPAATAEANLPLLQSADDARDVEVLSVSDGSISSIRDAVDGDRPVLLWFWAPH